MLLVVFIVFLICGPPIGFVVLVLGLVVSVAVGLVSPTEPAAPWRLPSFDEFGTSLITAYVIGGAQAFLTSVAAIISFALSDYTKVSFVAVMGTALAAGLCFLLVVGGPWISFTHLAAILCIHLGAALGCWLLALAAIGIAGRPADPPPNHDAYFEALSDLPSPEVAHAEKHP